MKILIVIDKLNSAIAHLAQAVKKYTPHHKIKILPIHPKGNSPEILYKASNLLKWADIIDIHYWKSGEVIKTTSPIDFKQKPKILFHFNPYDADKEEINKQYDAVVVGNVAIQDKIPFAHLIPYGVDLNFFKFNEDYTEEKIVNMVAARIEGKKGIREVAQVCKELGYKFRLVGRVSKMEYMKQVMEISKGSIEFLENANEEQLRNSYYQSAIHVCNSVDNFESGTLPVLEAMASGVPVLTRNVGHIPDIYDGRNMVVRKGQPEDLGDLKANLKEMMENRLWRLKLREKAWETIKNQDVRRMVWGINRLYNRFYKPTQKLMSVIIPTKDNPESFVQCLVGALSQDYNKYEVIVADSGDTPVGIIVDKAREKTKVPIKYIHFPHKGNYTLAEARNRAIVEAEGEYLIFCDDRIEMGPTAVSSFAEASQSKVWLWGMKDEVVKGFVENFSCVNRQDLINGGMFNERVQWYGGMTQEVRQRFEYGRGFGFVFISKARAKGIRRAKSKRYRRESIIEAKWLLFKLYS